MAKKPVKQTETAYQKAVDTAFEEVYANEPKSVIRSGKTGKARTTMMRAIALSKAERSVHPKRVR